MSRSGDGRADPSVLRCFPAFQTNLVTDSASFTGHRSPGHFSYFCFRVWEVGPSETSGGALSTMDILFSCIIKLIN